MGVRGWLGFGNRGHSAREGGGGGLEDWQCRTVAPNGKLLVAVATVRFGELPDLFAALPRLEDASRRHEALGARIKRQLSGCMEAIRDDNPSLHALLVSSTAERGEAAVAFGGGGGGGGGGASSLVATEATPVGAPLPLVAEEAATLADGVGTALGWFKQHLAEESRR